MASDAARLVSNMGDLPPLPVVATRVMALVQDKRTSVEDIAAVVGTDQALTAKLIRLANSAEYAFSRRSATARDAIQLLGFLQVRQIAVTSSLMAMFKGSQSDGAWFDPDLFWGHSLTVAVAAEMVARETGAARPDDAFTAGILHDIGRLVIRQAMPEDFAQAGRVAIGSGIRLHEAEIRVTGHAHEQVGRALARRWKFPASLAAAIARHHDETLTAENDGLAGVVAQCNRLVNFHGLTCGYVSADDPAIPAPEDLATVERRVGGIDAILNRASWFMDRTLGRQGRKVTVAA